MKSPLTLLTTLLLATATSISAAPLAGPDSNLNARQHFAEVGIQLANDQTGATQNADIPATGVDIPLSQFFGNSIWASSVQLVRAYPNTECAIKRDGTVLAFLSNEQTYVDLDGNPGAATPVSLDGAVINCHV